MSMLEEKEAISMKRYRVSWIRKLHCSAIVTALSADNACEEALDQHTDDDIQDIEDDGLVVEELGP